MITIQTAELKTCLNVLKSVSDAADLKKESISAQFVYAPSSKEFFINFSGKNAIFTYKFSEVISETNKPISIAFDWALLQTLKFPSSTVTFDLTIASVINFKSGKMSGDLPSNSGSEKFLTKKIAVKLEYKFNLESFIKNLANHVYGSHHNAVEATRRSVRVVGEEESLIFYSVDKQVSAKFKHKVETPIEIDRQILPKPLSSILKSLPSDFKSEFDLGFGKEFWRIRFQNIDVYLRNLVKEDTRDIRSLFEKVAKSPGNTLRIKYEAIKTLQDSFGAIAGKGTKELASTIIFRQNREGKVVVKLETEKLKNVEFDLELYELKGEIKDTVVFNYKYFHEFCSALLPEKEDWITIEWWDYNEDAPLKGKVISLFSNWGHYLIGRLKRR